MAVSPSMPKRKRFVNSDAMRSSVPPLFHAVFFTIIAARRKNNKVYAASTAVETKAGLPPEASARSSRLACVRG
jgi:hypothetical protein